MVKTLKDLPFSIAQKISEEDSIVWLKESNKYIVLDSTCLLYTSPSPRDRG